MVLWRAAPSASGKLRPGLLAQCCCPPSYREQHQLPALAGAPPPPQSTSCPPTAATPAARRARQLDPSVAQPVHVRAKDDCIFWRMNQARRPCLTVALCLVAAGFNQHNSTHCRKANTSPSVYVLRASPCQVRCEPTAPSARRPAAHAGPTLLDCPRAGAMGRNAGPSVFHAAPAPVCLPSQVRNASIPIKQISRVVDKTPVYKQCGEGATFINNQCYTWCGSARVSSLGGFTLLAHRMRMHPPSSYSTRSGHACSPEGLKLDVRTLLPTQDGLQLQCTIGPDCDAGSVACGG